MYASPIAELIVFDGDMKMSDVGESGCNCHMDANNAPMATGQSNCTATTAHASENPFKIHAPDWIWP